MERSAPLKAARSNPLGLLGLAARSRALVRGVEQTRAALRQGRIGLVLVARDASPAQRAKVERLARNRSVPVRVGWSGTELGRAVGTGPVSALGIVRGDFAAAMSRDTEAWKDSP